MKTESKENLVSNSTDNVSVGSAKDKYDSINEADEYVLTPVEKKFLLTAERGDCAGVRRLVININIKLFRVLIT